MEWYQPPLVHGSPPQGMTWPNHQQTQHLFNVIPPPQQQLPMYQGHDQQAHSILMNDMAAKQDLENPPTDSTFRDNNGTRMSVVDYHQGMLLQAMPAQHGGFWNAHTPVSQPQPHVFSNPWPQQHSSHGMLPVSPYTPAGQPSQAHFSWMDMAREPQANGGWPVHGSPSAAWIAPPAPDVRNSGYPWASSVNHSYPSDLPNSIQDPHSQYTSPPQPPPTFAAPRGMGFHAVSGCG